MACEFFNEGSVRGDGRAQSIQPAAYMITHLGEIKAFVFRHVVSIDHASFFLEDSL
jgi:hypothetical protein